MFNIPSPKSGFTTHFHCTACGHNFRREIRRIYNTHSHKLRIPSCKKAQFVTALGIRAPAGFYRVRVIVGDKGDYLYGTFGAPIFHEDDDERALLG